MPAVHRCMSPTMRLCIILANPGLVQVLQSRHPDPIQLSLFKRTRACTWDQVP